METPPEIIRSRWTSGRFFWLSLASFPAFLVITFISFVLWVGYSFSWEGDPPTILGYFFLWIAIGSAVLTVLAPAGLLITAIVLQLSKK